MSDKGSRLWGTKVGDAPASPLPETHTAFSVLDDTLPDSREYKAFKAVDREPFCLSIYTNGPANAHPAFQYYQYMMDDGHGKIFDIVFAFFVVRVRGHHLLPVIHAIKSRKCVFIQQYQKRADWPEPKAGESVIEKIEIVFQPAARTAMLEKG